MKNILFYGASVTHQSGESSYFDNLKKKCGDHLLRLSYPSAQLDNAGFFNIYEILKINPDIVFMEWSTTGEKIYDARKLFLILNFLTLHNIIPIFLILPQIRNYFENRRSEEQLYEISKAYNVPVLDLRISCRAQNLDLTDFLRDSVHTNKNGADLYSNYLANFLKDASIKPIKISPDPLLIPKINVYDLGIEVIEGKLLALEISDYDLTSEIAIMHEVGPYTPVIEIYSNDRLVATRNLWDQWCHYERVSFTTLIYSSYFRSIHKDIKILVSPIPPVYDLSANSNFTFSDQKNYS
jgi:hypothetical protein